MPDSGRQVVEVVRESAVNEMSFGHWVRDERRCIETARGAGVERLSAAERVDFLWLSK